MINFDKKPSVIKLNYKKKRIIPMTICIASICNAAKDQSYNSPAIIFCADRMITSNLSQFEHGTPKIKWIPDRAIIMEAGDGTLSDIVLDKEIVSFEMSDLDIKDIAYAINQKIIALRSQKIQDEVLSRFGFGYSEFTQRSKELSDGLMMHILKEMDRVTESIQLEFIVAGLDLDGSAQIYTVSSQEGVQCFNSVGFVAIGSGTPLSLLEITKSMHHSNLSISEALLKVYSAKKNSQRVSGVGRLTDLGILILKELKDENGNIEFDSQLIDLPEDVKKLLDVELENIEKSEIDSRESIKPKIDSLLYNPPSVQSESNKSEQKKKQD